VNILSTVVTGMTVSMWMLKSKGSLIQTSNNFEALLRTLTYHSPSNNQMLIEYILSDYLGRQTGRNLRYTISLQLLKT
jgi:hypothetical protein